MDSYPGGMFMKTSLSTSALRIPFSPLSCKLCNLVLSQSSASCECFLTYNRERKCHHNRQRGLATIPARLDSFWTYHAPWLYLSIEYRLTFEKRGRRRSVLARRRHASPDLKFPYLGRLIASLEVFRTHFLLPLANSFPADLSWHTSRCTRQKVCSGIPPDVWYRVLQCRIVSSRGDDWIYLTGNVLR